MANYKAPVLENFQWQQPVLDKDLASPPAASKGDRYIVAAGASGAWAGQSGKIALYTGVGWEFITPSTGMRTFVIDEILDYYYNAAWIAEYFLTSAERTKLNNLSGTNSGDVTLAANHGLSLTGQVLAMGTPSTVTPDTANGVATTTHTHALTGVVRNNGTVNPSNLVDNGNCENWTPAAADSYTSLLLHMDDTGLTDSSTFAHVMTLNGTAARSATWSKFGGYSLYCDGAGFLTAPNHAAFQFGSGDFTVEAQTYFTDVTTATQRLIAGLWKAGGGFNERSWILSWNKTSGNLEFIFSADGINIAGSRVVSWTPTINTAYHIEVVRNGNNLYFFVNGTQVGATQDITGFTLFASAALASVGASGSPATDRYFIGYLDEVRISKGIARHTTAFTPDTSPYSYSLDNWELVGAGASVNREVSLFKIGAYSAKLTRSGTDCFLYQNAESASKSIAYWKGRTVTIGALVYASSATVNVNISDGVAVVYGYHSAVAGWEYLTATITVDNSATQVRGRLSILTNSATAYFDGVIMVEGASAFAFAPKPLFVGPNTATELTTLGSALTIAGAFEATLGNIKATHGDIVIGTAGHGIDFSADPNAAGMTSELLDDYEEGTWTMGVSFGGGTTGITYSGIVGYYTRVGNIVTVTGYCQLTSKGSSSGTALLTGLPFTCVNHNAGYSTAALYAVNITFANQLQAYVNTNATTVALEEVTEAGVRSVLTDADFTNNSQIVINLTYRVA